MPHYYSKKQTSPLNKKTITVRCFDRTYDFMTGSGVFSKNRLDKGSRILIENARIEPGMSVLDMGCGIGVVAVILAKHYGDLKITMTDINDRAVMLAKKNVQQHGIPAEVVQGDLYENIEKKFDTILINPPQTAGKDVCFQLIEEAKDHLCPGGTIQLVARHKKGGKSLMEKMEKVFGNIDTLVKQGGYRVYLAKNE